MIFTNKKGEGDFSKKQPIDIIGNYFAYTKNGHVVVGIEIKWPGLFTIFEDDIEEKIIKTTETFALSQPAGTVFNYQNIYNKRFTKLENYQPDNYLDKSQEKLYSSSIKKDHSSFLFVSYGTSYNPSDFVLNDEESFTRVDKTSSKSIEKIDVEGLITNTKRLVDSLNDTGIIKAKLMTDAALRNYAKQYITFSFFEKPKYGSVRDEGNHIVVGHKLASFVSLSKNPGVMITDHSLRNFTTDFTKTPPGNSIGMPCSYLHHLYLALNIDHITNLVFVVHEDNRLKSKIKKYLKDFKGIGSRFDSNFSKAETIENFVQSVEQETGDRLVTYALNVCVIADSQAELLQGVDLTTRAFEKLSLPYTIENYHNLDLFLGGFLGNGYTLPRQHLSSLKRVNRLIAFETNGAFSDKGMLVTTKTGQPALLDTVSKSTKFNNVSIRKTNYNFLLFGKTGSGKSNLLAYKLMYLMNCGHHTVLIDKGNSFQKLELILRDKYRTRLYSWTDESPLSFNPFLIELKEEKYFYNSSNSVFIIQLLLGAISKNFNEDQIDMIKDLLQDFVLVAYYEHINSRESTKPCFNTFYEFFKSYHEDLLTKEKGSKLSNEERVVLEKMPYGDLIIAFKKFYKGGTYEHLFNAEESFDIERDQLVIFELDKIQNDEYLFRIVSICISQLVNEKMKSEKLREILKYFIIDEGTFMLNSYMAETIAGLFQTARKHGGGVGFTDQTFDKLVETGYANRMCGNSDTFILLEQKWTRPTEDNLRKYAEFTENGLRKVKSIDNSGNWREGAVKMNESIINFRLNLSPEYYLALNTDADNTSNQKMMDLYKAIGNIDWAIKQTIESEESEKKKAS